MAAEPEWWSIAVMATSLHRSVPLGAVLATLALTGTATAAVPLSIGAARTEVRAAASISVRNGDVSGFAIERCRRVSRRHVDCVVRFRDVRQSGRSCTVTFSVRLRNGTDITTPDRPICRF